jgi:DNA-binding GntR family transcriptional regulator
MPSTSPKANIVPTPKRGHVQDEIAKRIREGLMVGAFIPGQVMSLRKLAASFGTSPMPVRDALGQLVAANALEEMPNRSVRVPRLTTDRVKELFEVREMVESLAARNGARNATPALIRDLQGINRDLRIAIGKRDVLGALAANQKFHFTLYEAAESSVLMPLVESLWLQSGPTMYCSFLAPDMPWDASAHTEVLEGLRKKNPAAVQRAVARDIRTTGRHLVQNGAFQLPGGKLLAATEISLDL